MRSLDSIVLYEYMISYIKDLSETHICRLENSMSPNPLDSGKLENYLLVKNACHKNEPGLTSCQISKG
jgi:hypothetical protein